MYAYIIRRLWQMIPTILGVIVLVFILFNWVGGDPAYVLAGKISSAEQIANIRKQLGVDQPYYVQLWIFIKQVLTVDFGASWSTNETVSHILATRLGPSLTLLIPWLILSTLISIGLALAVAYVRGSLTDRAVMISCTVGLSISILVYIIVFQYVFAYKLGWFPVQGWGDSFRENLLLYSSLPILILLVVSIAPDLRLFRTFVLDEINQDYVRTGRAKGLSENRIMWLHVLRNASIPIITHVMAQLPGLLIGAFLVEELPKLEDYEIDLILSPVFTPKLADQAVFADVLGPDSVPQGQWPALIQELMARPTRAQLITVEGRSHQVSLREVTLERYVHRLRLEGSISESLVKRIDEGRKWIYYELTDKGRKILHPEKVAITLALASAIVLAAIGAFALISSSGSVLSGPGYSNQTALPAMRDASPSIGANLIGPLLFLLAVIALACALVIQRVGIRRRERFFQQLGAA